MNRALLRLSLGLAPALTAGFIAFGAQAATVSIQAPKEVVIGQTFQVNYVVQDAKAVDTVRFNGDYSKDLLELKSLNPSKALDSRSPSTGFSQANGSYSYGAFTIAEAANGSVSAGTFTFTAKQLGTATVVLKDGSLVLSAGENQLVGLGSAQIRIVEAKNEIRATSTSTAISVQSSSHPNEDAWYPSRDVTVSWKAEGGGITSVFIAFDDQPEGPAIEKVAASGSKNFTAPADGVWYAHVIVSYADGKRLRRDYRLQIDTKKPKDFALSTDYQWVDPSVPNYLRFTALDETSGVSEYRIYDGNTLVTTTTNPYFSVSGMEGEKTLTVEAIDKAGNVTRSTFKATFGPEFTKAQSGRLWWLLLFAMFLVAITALVVGLLIAKRRKEEKATTKRIVHSAKRK